MNFIKKIYYEKYSKKSYSISNVDLIIDRMFSNLNNGIYVDVTFGGGGHSRLILEQLKEAGCNARDLKDLGFELLELLNVFALLVFIIVKIFFRGSNSELFI